LDISQRLEEPFGSCPGGFADLGDWPGATDYAYLPDHSFISCYSTKHCAYEIERGKNGNGS